MRPSWTSWWKVACCCGVARLVHHHSCGCAPQSGRVGGRGTGAVQRDGSVPAQVAGSSHQEVHLVPDEAPALLCVIAEVADDTVQNAADVDAGQVLLHRSDTTLRNLTTSDHLAHQYLSPSQPQSERELSLDRPGGGCVALAVLEAIFGVVC
jgi:hypothetical protein